MKTIGNYHRLTTTTRGIGCPAVSLHVDVALYASLGIRCEMVVLLVVCFLLASVSVDARQLWPGVGHPPQECPTDEPPMGLPPSSSSETQCETPPKWISNIWYLDEYTGIMKAGRLFYDSDKQRIRKSVAILNIRENM